MAAVVREALQRHGQDDPGRTAWGSACEYVGERHCDEEPGLAMIMKQRPDALFVYPDVVLSSHPRPQQLAAPLSKPLFTVRTFRFRGRGGLVLRRPQSGCAGAAEQVAEILDGARPSDLRLATGNAVQATSSATDRRRSGCRPASVAAAVIRPTARIRYAARRCSIALRFFSRWRAGRSSRRRWRVLASRWRQMFPFCR